MSEKILRLKVFTVLNQGSFKTRIPVGATGDLHRAVEEATQAGFWFQAIYYPPAGILAVEVLDVVDADESDSVG